MNNSIFLDKEDVVKLTGTKVRKLQIEHLSKSNISFQLDRNGYPQVLTQTLLKPDTGKRISSTSKERVKSLPLIEAGVK
ncbi:DUF4224 domain-containing protein [Aliiglaciecola lipolytica]|uniref:DUF4224 domain-containing protein n=1 Tax=Aliiglaciecola lipolytica TaxID=477689 RepID=UPI001C09E4CF|nr:DUF4224 domain-containing protein [Aliiglaciecola lipolytica]MBU2880177.1 DUF4224 domain-containing protein [Aliiglaciecola lipolytica]|tara:strand:+ start:284 stop:520 length:237 start_codon:yes stop_codon:yes gene_type:complete